MTADPTTVAVCPECDSGPVHRRLAIVEPESGWRCRDCGATFEQPAERPPAAVSERDRVRAALREGGR